MKKIERALCSYIGFCNDLYDLLQIIKYEIKTKETRCGSFGEAPTSRIGVKVYFWENQVIKAFPGDCWSVKNHKGFLHRTAKSLNYSKPDEVWIKGKPHEIEFEGYYLEYIKEKNEQFMEIVKFLHKNKVKIKIYNRKEQKYVNI